MNMNKFQSDKEWLGRIIPSTGREKKNNIPLKSSPSTEKAAPQKRVEDYRTSLV